ncbi:MAG: cytochrome c [Leptospiraceae bacterium]|nr:cytochrome c [Leptospiraceae bacterium]
MNHKNLLILIFLSIAVFNCEYKKPVLEFFPDMYDSPARESQELDAYHNEYGRRLPPEGTVPVGYFPYEFADIATPDEMTKEQGLKNPYPSKTTLANFQRGESRYQIYCSPCHGVAGAGNGNVVGPYPKFSIRPPSVVGAKIQGWTDGQIYHIITMGRGLMASYAAQIEPDDRWKIILYIRKMQEAELKAKAPANK